MNKIFICLLVLFPTLLSAQFSEQQDITWPDKFIAYKELPDSLKNNDAVILSENLTVKETEIQNRVVIKILTENGLAHFKNLQLPQNFDLSNSPNFNKQGRFKNRINPFEECTVNYFIARIIKPNKKIIELPLKHTSNNVFWIRRNGEHINAKVYNFNFDDLQVGDILEYIYKISVNRNNLQEVIYPNGKFPKLNYNLTVFASAYPRRDKQDTALIYNTHIGKLNFKTTNQYKDEYHLYVNTYHYDYLKAINYPQNSQIGTTLPNVSVNRGFYNSRRVFAKIIFSSIDMVLERNAFQNNYRWDFLIDTLHENYYDNYNIKIRKFISNIEEDKTDTFHTIFLNRLTAALNNLKFVSAETMNYSGEAQYAVTSSEKLLEGKFLEEFMLKDYRYLLGAKNIFYEEAVLVDKRYSVANFNFRNHSSLEKTIFVLPVKKDYKFFIPRYNGLKYYADELPFYYEGAACVLFPCYNCVGNNKKSQWLFGYTPLSTRSDNVRSEAAIFKINLDSFMINATIKEHLEGQFSTILRPFYNKEAIDSTLPEFYFKKCTDKPLAFNTEIKQKLSEDFFPFKQKYHCTEKVNLKSKTKIDLHNWFSFTYKKEDFIATPTHDFYIDFEYADSYDFLFQFNKPVEIMNIDKFQKNIENTYFEVISSFTKQEGDNYLLNVRVKVKQPIIPQKDGNKLMEFINTLDEINSFEIELKK